METSQRSRRLARKLVFVFLAAGAATLVGPITPAMADETPFEMFGDNQPNVFEIVINVDNTIQLCVDGFCPASGEDRFFFKNIIVHGFDGDDVLKIEQNVFLTNGRGGLNITFHGGTGADSLQICPAGCPNATITSTTWKPGPAADGGSLTQTDGTDITTYAFDETESVSDLSPGPLTAQGTPDDDAIALGAGSPATNGRVTVGTLIPLEFSNKPTLQLEGLEGADRFDLEHPSTPTGLTGSCGGGHPVCVDGHGSNADLLVVRGLPGKVDELELAPSGQGAGAIGGLPGRPGVTYTGIEGLDTVLQHAEDTFDLVGSSADDVVEVLPSLTPGAFRVDATLRAGTPGAFTLPALSIAGANTSDAGTLNLLPSGGTDTLIYQGTARNDRFELTPGSGGDAFAHRIDGQLAHRLVAQGFASYTLEGNEGDDVLVTPGNLSVLTTWRGGAGANTLRFDGTGAGQVDVSLEDGTVVQAGFSAVTASSVQTLDVGAGANPSATPPVLGHNLRVSGSAAPETIRFDASGPQSGMVTRDGDARVLLVRGIGGVFSIDPLAGEDLVVLTGTAAADQVPVTRSTTLTAQFGNLLPARVTGDAEAVRIQGREGDDRFIVTGSGGPASLTVDGGDSIADLLLVTHGAPDADVRFSSAPGSGSVQTQGPAVGFVGVEEVDLEGDGTGTATIHGSDAADTILQTGDRVTVGAGKTVTYGRYPTLVLDGAAGADEAIVDPADAPGVTLLRSSGGSSGPDSLTVRGTDLSETLTYRPTGPEAGEVLAAIPVRFDGTGSLVVDGRTAVPSKDTLIVDSGAITGTMTLDPGTTFDAGVVVFRDGSGATRTAPPLEFANLGTGSIRFGTAAGPRTDALVYRGTSGSDVAGIDGGGIVTLNTQIPVHTPGIHTLTVEMREGADTVSVVGAHPFPGGSPGVIVDGGGPDGGDVLNVAGGGAPATSDAEQRTITVGTAAPIAHGGVERINLGAAATLTALGTSGPDVVTYTPTGGDAGTLAAEGDPTELRFTSLAGALTIEPAAGADRLVVNGRSSADAISIARGDLTQVSVGSLKPASTPAATEALEVRSGDGADVISVSGQGGPAALSVHGGPPTGVGDRLELVSPSAQVTYGTDPTGGVLEDTGGAVAFTGIEHLGLQGDGTGQLTVVGTNAPNAITAGGGTSPEVQVDAGSSIGYEGFDHLVLDGLSGDDTFTISHDMLGSLTTIKVIGGNPSISDELVVMDRPGSTRRIVVTPTASDAGQVTFQGLPAVVTFETVEDLHVDGLGGGDELQLTTPVGVQSVRAVPGTGNDAGSLLTEGLVPVHHQRLGAGIVRLSDAGGARVDSLVYDGSAAGNAFTVTGPTGVIGLDARIPVLPDAIADLRLHAFDGDDAFTLTGPLPFTTLRADGAGPDGADAVSITGPVGPVVADLGAGRVTGYGGTITIPGIERLATDIGGGELTATGTALDDALCYDPLGALSGRVYVAGAPGGGGATTICAPDQRGTNTLHTFTDVGSLILDPAAGADEVIVNATTDHDLISVRLTYPRAQVVVHPSPADPQTERLMAQVVVDTTERLSISADQGSDIFDITAYDGPSMPVFIDGESPSTKFYGDELRFRDGTGRAHLQNTRSHVKGEGTVTATYTKGSGAEVRVDYRNVQSVTLYRDSKTS